MRCARVGVAIRNAPAIASVVRPHTSRSVSAMRASSDEARVAAGEDQAKAVVLDRIARVVALFPAGRVVGDVLDVLGGVVERDEAPLAAEAVDGAKASGGDEPGDGVRRHALRGPLLRRGDEGVVQRVLGEIEAAEQPHQRREHAAALVSGRARQRRRPWRRSVNQALVGAPAAARRRTLSCSVAIRNPV